MSPQKRLPKMIHKGLFIHTLIYAVTQTNLSQLFLMILAENIYHNQEMIPFLSNHHLV